MAVADSILAGDPVARESRLRMPQAAIASVAGICMFAGFVVQSIGQPKVGELTITLIAIHQHTASEVGGAVLTAIGLLGLALTLNFLAQASRARRPESAPATRIAALAGGVLASVATVADAVVLSIKATDFVAHGSQTYVQAHDLVTGGVGIALPQYAGLLGSLLVAMTLVLISMNAMRVGLLTKFLGYVGIVAAAASLFLLGSVIGVFIEAFWLLAVAYLLAGRWPGGDPPTWASGVAAPWPSAAELREQRMGASGRTPSKAKPAPAGRSGPRAAEPAAGAAGGRVGGRVGPQTTRSTTPKRKRKRRK